MITGGRRHGGRLASAIIVAKRLGPGVTIDPDHAVTAGHPAEQRHVGQLALHHHHRRVGETERVDRLDHRLVLDRDQIGLREFAVPFEADAEDVADQPMMELRPGMDDGLHRRSPIGDTAMTAST